jgi:hypothetical protein
MAESQAFAVAFAQLALLINLGRLNTTHAMTPESKQPMRYYHPMPALQATEAIRKNLIDSAKFRGMLKAVKLPGEDVVPDTMHKMAAAARAGQRPSTSIVNCLYIMLTDATVRFVVKMMRLLTCLCSGLGSTTFPLAFPSPTCCPSRLPQASFYALTRVLVEGSRPP